MAEAVFLIDIAAPVDRVHEALTSHDGVVGWWTDDMVLADGMMSLGFSDAPERFSLRVDVDSDEEVTWTSVGDFPPHWKGTRISWTLADSPEAGGSRVFFEHAGFAAPDPMLGHTSMVWGNLMNSLKAYCETGNPSPMLAGAQ